MTSDENPWPSIYTALGQLVVASGQVEATVENLMLNMLGGPHWRRTQLVIGGYSANQLNDRVERLAYLILEGTLQDDVLAWIGNVRESQVQRNNIVHADWVSGAMVADGVIKGPATISTRVRKPRRGLEINVTAWTAEEIRALVEGVSRLFLTGTELIVELQQFSLAEARGTPDLAPWSRELATNLPRTNQHRPADL